MLNENITNGRDRNTRDKGLEIQLIQRTGSYHYEAVGGEYGRVHPPPQQAL